MLSATDPANPYGTTLKWPNVPEDGGRGPTRTVGAHVVIVNGALAAYISRGARQLLVFLPEDEPVRSTTARALAGRLASLARDGDGLLIAGIGGLPASDHPLAPFLVDAGFYLSPMGLQMRRPSSGSARQPELEIAGRGRA